MCTQLPVCHLSELPCKAACQHKRLRMLYVCVPFLFSLGWRSWRTAAVSCCISQNGRLYAAVHRALGTAASTVSPAQSACDSLLLCRRLQVWGNPVDCVQFSIEPQALQNSKCLVRMELIAAVPPGVGQPGGLPGAPGRRALQEPAGQRLPLVDSSQNHVTNHHGQGNLDVLCCLPSNKGQLSPGDF